MPGIYTTKMTLNLFSLLTILSIFLTLILSVFFFITRRGFTGENKILATLLLIFNLQIFYSFATSAFDFQFFLDWHKPLFLLRQTSFLIGPLLYFYIVSFLKKNHITNHFNSIHLLPFAAAVAYLLIFYRTIDQFVLWESYVDLNFTILILSYNLFYIILSLLSMKSTILSIKGFYKNILISSENTWLQILLVGFIMVWIVNLNSFAIYMIIQRPGWCAYTASIYALTAFLFISTIMFCILFKPDVYYIIAKYKNNKLREQDKLEYQEKIKSHMEKNKPYLDPEITLESLAKEMSLNPRILSQIINETYKKKFKSFILEYRIKESMLILANSKYVTLPYLKFCIR